MKKLALCALFVLCVAGTAFSEGSDNYYRIRMFMDTHRSMSRYDLDNMRLLSQSLTMEEKYNLYTSYKMSPAAGLGGSLVNVLLPGFGLGNYLIGDRRGAQITLVTSIVSLGALFIGYEMENWYYYDYSYYYYSSSYYASPADLLMIAGTCGYLFCVIRGIVTPFIYVDQWNRQLVDTFSGGPFQTSMLDRHADRELFHMNVVSIRF